MRAARLAIATAALLAIGATPAAAQDTDVDGKVPSFLSLSLDEPRGFATFPAGPARRELDIHVRVTSTERGAQLSVADGDLASGSRLGRMASGASMLSQPLAVTVGSDPFQPLSLAVEPPLATFRQPVANARATVRLSQAIEAGERPRGSYEKTLLITLSSNAP